MSSTPIKSVINLIARGCGKPSSTNFQPSLLNTTDGASLTVYSPANLRLVTSHKVKHLLSADNVGPLITSSQRTKALKCRTEYVLRNKRSHSNQKVARCLFSKNEQENVSTSNCTNLSRPNLPLFDTPHRKKIPSTDEAQKIFKGCVLGRGSFGTVVKGIYKGKEVAIKLIYYSKKKNVFNSFEREENALKLTHANIIRVFKVTNILELSIGCVFMEYYPHWTLEKVLVDLIPFHIKIKYLSEIASALEYCHSQSILHLDVKPNNILIGSMNNVSKLCDFGSSIQLESVTPSGSSPKGTLKYCAPEILRGGGISEKADVYSFGVTMWQVLHQETPYDSEDLHVVIYKVVKQRYRPSKSKSKTALLDSGLENMYKACWEEKPINRPPMSTISTMLGEVKQRLLV